MLPVAVSLRGIVDYFVTNAETWFSILLGVILSILITWIVYRIQKKQSHRRVLDEENKFKELEQMHHSDADKIELLFTLLLKSQAGNISIDDKEKLEAQILNQADTITARDSTEAQALKAIAHKDKAEGDRLINEIAAHEHDLLELYKLRAMNEFAVGNYHESTKWYKKVYELEPENRGNLKSYIYALMQSGSHEEAYILVDKLLALLQKDALPDLNELAYAYGCKGSIAGLTNKTEAEELLRKAIELKTRAGKPECEITDCFQLLALVLQSKGNYKEAGELLDKTIKLLEENPQCNRQQMVTVKRDKAELMITLGQYHEAGELLKQSYELAKELFGEDHPRTQFILGSYGSFKLRMGQAAEAEQIFLKQRELILKTMTPNSKIFQGVNSNLIGAYLQQKKLDEAEELCLSELERLERHHGRDSEHVMPAIGNLAVCYLHQEKFEQSLPLVKEVYDNAVKAYPPQHQSRLTAMRNYAAALHKTGNLEAAEKLNLELLEILQMHMPNSFNFIADMYRILFMINKDKGALDQCENYLKLALTTLGEHPGQYPVYSQILSGFVKFYTEQGRETEAAEYQARLDQLKTPMGQN